MIALAAATWKLGIKPTLIKLAKNDTIPDALGAPGAIDDYREAYDKPRERVTKFWSKCQDTHILGETSTLRLLQQRFAANNQDESWRSRAGQFLGSCFKKQVDACFNPKRVEAWDETKGKRTGTYSSNIFRGPKWNELLAIPFYDLPGRICGFAYVGRDCRPNKDWLYKGTLDYVHEGGLAMLSALMKGEHRRLGHTKFVFTDVEAAVRLQVRHMRDSYRPLPLAATWDDEYTVTERVWQWFKAKDLIFWGSDPLKTIHQARLAGAKVSMLVVTPIELNTNMRNYSPTEWLERMRRHAVWWTQALEHYIEGVPEADIEAIFLQLGLQGRELLDFIKGCKPELRERLKYIHDHRVFAAKIRFEKQWVFEKQDGWYLEKGGDRISNAIVRVEQVLTTLDNKSYYRGHIKFEGKSYPFTEKATTLDRGMLAWAQGYLRDVAKAGVCEFYPSWNKKSLQLTLAFHTPTYAQGVELIGWDAENRQFNFPKFSITAGGQVTDDFSCLFDHDTVPARDVPVPGPLPTKHKEALSDVNDETQIFWATAACVAANIIAPAVNRNPVPILLDGEGAYGVGLAAATRMGCIEAGCQSRNDVSITIANTRGPHQWPLAVVSSGGLRPGPWLDSEPAQNCLYQLPWATNRVLAMRGRSNMIVHERKLGSMQLAHHAAPYVLPNYIQDLYRRSIMLAEDQPDLAGNVLDDMSDWFARVGGNREAVEAAHRILHTPGKTPPRRWFSELVFRLFEEGSLTTIRTKFQDSKTATAGIVQVDDEDKSLVWVSQDRFSDAVKAAGSVPPDLLLITKSLEKADILVSEPDYRKEQGWLLSGDWWTKKLDQWRSR